MSNNISYKSNSIYKIAARVLAYIQIVVASLVLIGWVLDLDVLKNIIPGLATMKFNTAVCFIAAGFSLLYNLAEKKNLSIGLAAVVIAIPVLTLLEYIFVVNFGIDELLFKDYQTSPDLFPGRIAIATSIDFVLVGAALILLNYKDKVRIIIGQLIAALVMLVALVALAGYLFNAQALYQISIYSTVALHTASLFFLFSIALQFIKWDSGFIGTITNDRHSGITARRLLLPALIIPLIFGGICAYYVKINLIDYSMGFSLFAVSTFLFFSLLIWLNSNLIQKNEEEFIKISNAVNQTDDMVFITNAKGIIEYVNPAFERDTGYSPHEIIGNTPRIIKSSLQDDAYYKTLWDTIIAGKIFRGTPINRKKNGEHYIAQQTISPIRNFRGEITHFVSTCKDITNLKKAEEELSRSEKQYRQLFETTSDLIQVTSPEGKILFANSTWHKVLGYTEAELLNLHIDDIIHPDELAKCYEFFKRSLNGEKFEYVVSRFVSKRGKFIDVEGSISCQTGDHNSQKITCFLRDVTERKRTEIDLIKFKHVIEQGSVSVVITDIEGKIEYVNPHFTSLTGYQLNEVLWKTPRVLSSGYHNQEFYQELWATIISGNIWRGELLNKKKNGETYWALVIISPIYNLEGKITHFAGIEEDITDKKKLFEELVVAKEKAEEMNKVKSYFFANMSHELRTPLIGILGFSEVLKDSLESDEDLRSMAETILVGGNRLLNTLNLILNISKVESDKLEKKIFALNIVPHLKRVFEKYKRDAVQLGLDYQFTSVSEEIICKVDSVLVENIFNQIVNNAFKFTHQGSVSIHATVTDSKAVVTVTDTGIGIPKDKQDIVWYEFRQASEGLSRSFEGTGLGLTIAKKYAEAIGGKIFVTSEEGKGSTFTVELPLAIGSSVEEKIEVSDAQIKTGKNKISSEMKTVLFVDDDFVAIEVVRRILSQLYKLEFANSGKEALEKVNAKVYDAILMDINLRRDMDGVMVTYEIRKLKKYKDIPIIAITAFAMEEEREEFLSKGMTHYISKPFSKQALIKLMAEVFN